MEGGYKENQISDEDKKNILNAEITELERRKRDLSKEVEDYYRAYKNKLDLDYNTRLGKINDTEAQREIDYKKRLDSLAKKEAFVTSQISSGEAEIKSRLDEADKKIKEGIEAGKNYAKLSEELKAEDKIRLDALADELVKSRQAREDISKEKAIVKEIQDRLLALEKQNQETQRRLDTALKDAESRSNYLVYLEGELKNKEAGNTALSDSLNAKKLNLDNRESEIVKKEENTKKLLEEAQQLANENKIIQETLNKLISENKEQSEKLTTWRDELDEKDISAKEKERYLLIREREIDGKIRILQKLRESEGGK